jgi:hypothetical protein
LANNPIETYEILGKHMGIRLCPGPKHFDGLYIFKRAEGVWKMTLMVDDLKQYQTQKWWRKCAIYLQKTAT